ncbi:hypothetical protein TNCV_4966341 [Trichonephila clavipes]|nr:hypothetical protein TNCV_4966341 [Trichonephila clavipes]
MQVTIRFCSVPTQFRGRNPWGDQGPPTSLPFPPATREDLRFNGYLEYPMPQRHYTFQTSMSSPKFESNSYGTAVSVTNHYTGWAT